MSSVPASARRETDLSAAALQHLDRLVMSWQPLADLSFADLLLFAPVHGEEGRFVVIAQVRPVTGQTAYPHETVGQRVHELDRPMVGEAFATGEQIDGEGTLIGGDEAARLLCIPVRFGSDVIGVVARYTAKVGRRRRGELERNYLDAFRRFARMISAGSFPFPVDELRLEELPRVGDGVVIVEADLTMRFASPNAVSAMHRMGIHAYGRGARLRDLGFDERAVRTAMDAKLPVLEEVEQGDSNTMLRVLPFLEHGEARGAILLVRDVTDLRRRDRMLMTKDATIREIHHRVKNNLQTIAALLRLQGRRLDSEEGRDAIMESERRIRSIAIVHETLSQDARETVPFDEIARRLTRVAEESVPSPDLDVSFTVEGAAGELPGDVATPLAVVLNELLQNTLDHAFDRESGRGGTVRVVSQRDAGELTIEVVDDGAGLPAGFDLVRSSGLGLSIVQALVESELGGKLELRSEAGTTARLTVPVSERELMEARPLP